MTAKWFATGDGNEGRPDCSSRLGRCHGAGHDLRQDPHPADRVVPCLLDVRHPEGRHLGTEPWHLPRRDEQSGRPSLPSPVANHFAVMKPPIVRVDDYPFAPYLTLVACGQLGGATVASRLDGPSSTSRRSLAWPLSLSIGRTMGPAQSMRLAASTDRVSPYPPYRHQCSVGSMSQMTGRFCPKEP